MNYGKITHVDRGC